MNEVNEALQKVNYEANQLVIPQSSNQSISLPSIPEEDQITLDRVDSLGDVDLNDLTYVVRGTNRRELKFAGVKHLVLRLSLCGHPLEFVSDPEVVLRKYSEDQREWVWEAKAKMRNITTRLLSFGVGDKPYLMPIKRKDNGKLVTDSNGNQVYDYVRDPNGRTTAVSKSIRNAMRPQIPEAEARKFINSLVAKKKNIEEPSITQEQIQTIQELSPGQSLPKTQRDAETLIRNIHES